MVGCHKPKFAGNGEPSASLHVGATSTSGSRKGTLNKIHGPTRRSSRRERHACERSFALKCARSSRRDILHLHAGNRCVELRILLLLRVLARFQSSLCCRSPCYASLRIALYYIFILIFLARADIRSRRVSAPHCSRTTISPLFLFLFPDPLR